VSAYHGDNHVPLVARHFKKDRSAMLQMVGALELIATSSDDRVLRLLARVGQRLLGMATAIWFNTHTGVSSKRSLIAYDH
jgi:hypothetical protein